MSLDREEICRRYGRLYTGLIADVLDQMGIIHRILPQEIRPVHSDMMAVGFAYTVRGIGRGEHAVVSGDPEVRNRLRQITRTKQVQILEQITPYSLVVLDAGGDPVAAHWGEMLSLAARNQGATGVVLNGGVRDTRQIIEMNFPVFARFFSPATAFVRWDLVDSQVPVKLTDVTVTPGDLVAADIDGAVVVPRNAIEQTLVQAEAIAANEGGLRDALKDGAPVRAVFEKYGSY